MSEMCHPEFDLSMSLTVKRNGAFGLYIYLTFKVIQGPNLYCGSVGLPIYDFLFVSNSKHMLICLTVRPLCPLKLFPILSLSEKFGSLTPTLTWGDFVLKLESLHPWV